METRYTNLSQILMYHVHMNTKEYKKVDITELQIVSKFTLRELYEVNYAPINSYVSSFQTFGCCSIYVNTITSLFKDYNTNIYQTLSPIMSYHVSLKQTKARKKLGLSKS